jgi:hypothetical protein
MSAIYVDGTLMSSEDGNKPDDFLLMRVKDYILYCKKYNKEVTDKALLQQGCTKDNIIWLKEYSIV